MFYKKNYFVFVFFLVAVLVNSYSQADCSTAVSVCTNAGIEGGTVNGFGRDDFNGLMESGCLKTGLGVNTIETNSYWYRIKLAESGQFGFTIKPNDPSEDWDFAIYGPNATCNALISPVACNYIKTSPTGNTGVGVDPETGTQTNAYDSWMQVLAGEEYVILINQYAGNNSGFSITWEGAVIEDNSEPLDCNIVVNLGSDRNLCSGQSSTLSATTFGESISYEWFLFNATTGNFDTMSIYTPTLVVTTTGNYKVVVTDTVLGDIKTDNIIVTFHTFPIAGTVYDLVRCDPDENGTEDFNLEVQTEAILNDQSGMIVTYHESEIFANAGVSPLSSPYTSSGKTIWARIQNSANTSCYDTTSFDIILVLPPIANQPPDLFECDSDNDGKSKFILDIQSPIVLGDQLGIITYYDDQENADDRKGWIVNSSDYESGSRTIWARIEPSTGSVCYDITSFELEVLEKPFANQAIPIRQCDFDNDGLYEFDFETSISNEILLDQDPETFEIHYFSSQENADGNFEPLPSPYTNVTPYALETIYARIQNIERADCYETTSFTLQVFDTPYPAVPENIPDLIKCDDLSDGDDTNGYYEFDLTERQINILDGQSPYVFEITYFEDSGYTDQIVDPTAYTNSIVHEQTIYVEVENGNPNNVRCSSQTSFLIKVEPLPNTLLAPFDFMQCDVDGVPDGIVDFRLSEADTFITLGANTFNVTYHLIPQDATSGINMLNKDSFSNRVSSTVYARVESVTGCIRIVQVNLVVSVTSFPSDYMRDLVECDDDGMNDGFHEFNLTQTTSEIISLFPSQNLRVAFYRNQEDALYEENIINPANAYSNETPDSQLIWVRVESSVNGGCFDIAQVIQLIVNPIPEFDLDETGIVCLNIAPLTVSTFNAQDNYTYQWIDEAGNIVGQQAAADIFQAGVYTVIATSNQNCQSFSKQIEISEFAISDFSFDDIQITESSVDNTLTINSANQNLGIGEYEFALNDRNGPYQDEPYFSRVPPGQHTIFVREKNNCGIVKVTVNVFGFPKFFTPNNDGINDNWNVLGVDPATLSDSRIIIFDRYGKMLASFGATQQGWDGSYNSKKVNSSDYWYLAEFVDLNGNESVYKGHFSLVR